MLKRYKPICLSSLFLFLVIVLHLPSSAARFRQENPVYGGVFRIKPFADDFEPQLDPAKSGAYIFVLEQIYNGLVHLDKNLNIMPSLAEYWQISQDGTTYTFYLKKGIRFHHGEEVTADDVKFSFERLLDKDVDSPYYQFFLDRVIGAREFREGKAEDVSGLRVLDTHTLEIRWTRPYVSSLYLLSMHFCKVLPRDLVIKQGDGFFRRPSGTGPFQFDYWLRDNRLNIVGVRMKHYDAYFRGRPYLDAVEFCPLFTYDHFKQGLIDSIPVFSDRLMESDYQIFQDGSLQLFFLGISCHIPPLDDPRIRKILAYGIQKQDVVRAVKDVSHVRQVTNRYISSRLPGFPSSEGQGMFDAEKAKQRLSALGYGPDERFPELTLFLEFPRSDFKFKIYRELRKQLNRLGIDLRVKFYKSTEDIKEASDPYLVLIDRGMNIPDPENMIRPLFFSESNFNLLGYANHELDSLLHKAEVERSWTNRIKLFHQMEQILLKDIPAIPLYSQQNRVAMLPHVRGVAVPPLGLFYLEARKIWLLK
jgi:ABC-type transport system substrate-binding protein